MEVTVKCHRCASEQTDIFPDTDEEETLGICAVCLFPGIRNRAGVVRALTPEEYFLLTSDPYFQHSLLVAARYKAQLSRGEE